MTTAETAPTDHRRRPDPAQWLHRAEKWLSGERHAVYGFAAMRIGFALILLADLLRNVGAAPRVWGVGSAWLDPVRDLRYGWPVDLMQDAARGPLTFSLWYALTFAAGLAYLVGWRTRILTPLLYVLFTGLVAQNPLVTDNGDLTFRLLLMYTTFADTGAVWSLDSRRRARRAARQLRPAKWRTAVGELTTVVHNFALIVVVGNLCLLYLVAGLMKVQEPLWVDGSAIYYALSVQLYQPWPALSQLAWWSTLGVLLVSYFSVLIEVFFPILIISRRTRWIAVIGIIGMHLGIGLLMGLWTFSAFMAMVDTILISTRRWRSVERWVLRVTGAARARLGPARSGGHRRPDTAGADRADPDVADSDGPDPDVADSDGPDPETATPAVSPREEPGRRRNLRVVGAGTSTPGRKPPPTPS